MMTQWKSPHYNHQLASQCWIFVLVENFHHNKRFSSKINFPHIHENFSSNFIEFSSQRIGLLSQGIFHHNCRFHYHGQFLLQWWTFITMSIFYHNGKYSAQRKQFHCNDDILSPWWIFIAMLNFPNIDEFSSQSIKVIKMMNVLRN